MAWRAKIGRSGWIRTNDPLLPKQMRYQTAPHSDMVKPGFISKIGVPGI